MPPQSAASDRSLSPALGQGAPSSTTKISRGGDDDDFEWSEAVFVQRHMLSTTSVSAMNDICRRRNAFDLAVWRSAAPRSAPALILSIFRLSPFASSRRDDYLIALLVGCAQPIPSPPVMWS